MQKGHFGNGSREILAFAHVVVVSSDDFAGNSGLKKKILISSAKPKGGRVPVKYKWSKFDPGVACAGGLIRDGGGRWLHEMDLGVLVSAIKASSSSLVCEPLFKKLNLLPQKDWEDSVGLALPRFCRL
ncbi:hypothetical protein OIU77_012520 [Salix suchowensis]|uniref:Uncharacterized protein n=1 Tax=Salix suchowensis TaxID=1278906 RepID=A0ABQ9A4Q8_9ROSI|nr:hypothetical protein OIU77_012520 [Salix suchowensis]